MKAPQLRVLFLGNSYTHCNRMPWMVSCLAASAPEARRLQPHMIAPGGVSLEWHAGNQATRKALLEASWDIVVLQDHSLGPIEHQDRFVQYGTELSRMVRSNGAKCVFYLTWARQHLPEMQSELTQAYMQLAQATQTLVAPVGLAWERALAENERLVLHTEDRSHPNARGSYLAACVFYATFYDESPEGLAATISVDGEDLVCLSLEEAGSLQRVARDVVKRVT